MDEPVLAHELVRWKGANSPVLNKEIRKEERKVFRCACKEDREENFQHTGKWHTLRHIQTFLIAGLKRVEEAVDEMLSLIAIPILILPSPDSPPHKLIPRIPPSYPIHLNDISVSALANDPLYICSISSTKKTFPSPCPSLVRMNELEEEGGREGGREAGRDADLCSRRKRERGDPVGGRRRRRRRAKKEEGKKGEGRAKRKGGRKGIDQPCNSSGCLGSSRSTWGSGRPSVRGKGWSRRRSRGAVGAGARWTCWLGRFGGWGGEEVRS